MGILKISLSALNVTFVPVDFDLPMVVSLESLFELPGDPSQFLTDNQRMIDSRYEGGPAALVLKHLDTIVQIPSTIPQNTDQEEILFQQYRAIQLFQSFESDYLNLSERKFKNPPSKPEKQQAAIEKVREELSKTKLLLEILVLRESRSVLSVAKSSIWYFRSFSKTTLGYRQVEEAAKFVTSTTVLM